MPTVVSKATVTGNWDASDGTIWAAGVAPVAGDDVQIVLTSGTITIVTGAVCRSVDFTGTTATITHTNLLTVGKADGAAGLSNIAATLVSGMTYSGSGGFLFIGTYGAVAQTIDWGGKTAGATFNGVGGSWKYTSTHNGAVTVTAGTFDTNGQTCAWAGFDSSGTGVRSVKFGASAITVTAGGGTFWNTNTQTSLTFDAGTSVITAHATSNTPAFSGAFGTAQIYDLVVSADTGTNCGVVFNGLSCRNFTMTAGSNAYQLCTLSGNFTVSGTFTVTGNSSAAPINLSSDTSGTARTITAAVVALTDVYFTDITGAGASSWDLSAAGNRCGDVGGNSGITFTTAQDNYWVADTGNWSDSSKWKLSDHTTAGRVPLPQDGAKFDASSFTAGSKTVTCNMKYAGKDISFTGATNTPTLSLAATFGQNIFGSLTLISGMTLSMSSSLSFSAKRINTCTLTSAGKTFTQAVTISVGGSGSLTFQDAFICSSTLTVSSGTFSTGGFSVSASTFSATGSTARTLTLGASTITLTSTGLLWTTATTTSLTVTANTAIVKITDTSATARSFSGGGFNFNGMSVWNAAGAGTGILTFLGSNTFGQFKDTGTAAHTVKFTAGTTTTVSSWLAIGSAGNVISFDTDTGASTFAVAVASGGWVVQDYVSMTRCTVTTSGAAPCLGISAHSTNGTGSTGWVFGQQPVSGGGNWSATATWVSGVVPVAADDVFIVGYTTSTVTIDSGSPVCNSLSCLTFVSTLSHTTLITLAIGSATAGYSNVALKLVSGMTYTAVGGSLLSFISTSAAVQTVDFAGKNSGSTDFNASSNGSWQLTGTWGTAATANTFTLTKGTLDFNGQICYFQSWINTGSGIRTAIVGGATAIHCVIPGATAVNFNSAANFTFTIPGGSTATLYIEPASGEPVVNMPMSWPNIVLAPGSGAGVAPNNLYAVNLTVTGAANRNAYISIQNSANNFIITGSITFNGNSTTNRLLIRSDTYGTTRRITNTGASMSGQNVDFRDITMDAAWNASAITGGSGNCGGNTGFTFTTGLDLHYQNTNGGNWNVAADWDTSPSATQRIPLPQDNAIIDKAFGSGKILVINMPRFGHNIDLSGATWTGTALTLNTDASIGLAWYGDLIFVTGQTLSTASTWTYEGDRVNDHIFDTKGLSFAASVNFYAFTKKITLASAFACASSVGFRYGTLDTAGFSVSTQSFITTFGDTRTLTLGATTWSLTGTGIIWDVDGSGGGLTVTSAGNTSTIKITNTTSSARTFNGFGKTYYNLWSSAGASTASWTVQGSNTFNQFKDDGTAAHSILITAGTTQTVTTFTVIGTAGNLITINSNSTATHTLTKAGGGTVSCDYLDIQHSFARPWSGASGADTWYAGANSTDHQATATSGNGWIFTAPPGGNTTGFFPFF